MQEGDCLQRADHDFELRDLVFGVPRDDVHAIDGDAVDHRLEFKNSHVALDELLRVVEALVAEYMQRPHEVDLYDGLPTLRSVDDR